MSWNGHVFGTYEQHQYERQQARARSGTAQFGRLGRHLQEQYRNWRQKRKNKPKPHDPHNPYEPGYDEKRPLINPFKRRSSDSLPHFRPGEL
ncbi:hypothetical protein JCM10207_003082 [Rhodosporidiobolus poonsookiae]